MIRHDGESIAERVYARLKQDLLTGILDPHERLDIAELAARYEISPTPLREAAMRLFGERLVERHPRGGLRPASITEALLKALLEARLDILNLVLDIKRRNPSRPRPAGTESDRVALAAPALFREIAEQAGNSELAAIVGNLDDRLERVRRIEHEVLGDTAEDTAALARLWHAKDAGVRRAMRAYHRRRMKAAAQLVWRANA